MFKEKVMELINNGENITVEFKQSRNKLNKDVYDSVCSFLNRFGGHLFLGVRDDRTIVGVDENSVQQIKKDFVSGLNNGNKINPTVYLNIEEFIIDEKTILYINIPESSQVHRHSGKIFDRNEDGDFDITNNTNMVSKLYMRKQNTYTENKIFPFAKIDDLETDIFVKVRKLANNQKPNHPWTQMSDLELLRSVGFYTKDLNTGIEGVTLAGILIFGSEELICEALSHYKTDAILRVENLDRYDDRDDVRVNLIRSYERLMQFVEKHLNDKFYLEGDQRVSLRDKIFREVISNLLIHREFSDAFPAKFIIYKDRVYVENGNKSHGNGIIDPENFSPYPKNPKIARFFKEIGWVDELGSGVRNVYKYSKLYSGADPKFLEGDVFKTIIPLVSNGMEEVSPKDEQKSNLYTEYDDKIIEFCKTPRSSNEIQQHIGLKDKEYFRKNILNPLINKGYIKKSIPDKPTSSKQKYYSKKIITEN